MDVLAIYLSGGASSVYVSSFCSFFVEPFSFLWESFKTFSFLKNETGLFLQVVCVCAGCGAGCVCVWVWDREPTVGAALYKELYKYDI